MGMRLFFLALRNKLHLAWIKRNKGITIGHHTSVYYKCKIDYRSESFHYGGGCVIGSNCMIGRSSRGYHGGMPFYTRLLLDGKGSKIIIGDNCRINGAYIHSERYISIGSNCVIASGVNILDSNGHQVKSFDRTIGRDVPKDIVIGNNVWICMNATILKGTTIGDNSIIGAGSIIQGDIPANSIASTHNKLTINSISFNNEQNEKH